MIGTLLGSCISVVLIDVGNQVAGMNHFLLPSSIKDDIFITKTGKYGMNAMELLINEIMKLGGQRKRFQAKVFGGGSVLAAFSNTKESVPMKNINFIREYLDIENIPIIASDVGGNNARKVFLYPTTGRVLMKRIPVKKIEEIDEFEKLEIPYIERINKE